VPESWGGRFGSTSVSKNRLWSSRFQIPRLAPDFGELDSFQKPAQAIQNPDSAPRRGFWNLDRFQDPDIAMQNPDYAPRPAIWKLKDKIQIPNSETAVSIYAPALMPHHVLTCAWHTDARIEGCTDRTVLAPSMAPLHPPPAPHVARRNGRRDLGDSAAMAPTCFAGMRARAKAKKSPKQRPACWVNLSGIRILHTFILAVHDSFMKNSSATVKL
jgi:hypothetical protein